MSIKLRREGESLSERDIVLFEERLGSRLPEDYRVFVRERDGASPESNIFTVPGSGTQSSVNEYLSRSQIVEQVDVYASRIAPQLIPVALAEGGNLVCLHLESGTIVFWDHELENADPIQFLAVSFSRFLQMLRPFDIRSIEQDPDCEVWVSPRLRHLQVNPPDRPAPPNDK